MGDAGRALECKARRARDSMCTGFPRRLAQRAGHGCASPAAVSGRSLIPALPALRCRVRFPFPLRLPPLSSIVPSTASLRHHAGAPWSAGALDRCEWLLLDGGSGHANGNALGLPSRPAQVWWTIGLPDGRRVRLLGGVDEWVETAAGPALSLLPARWQDRATPDLPPVDLEFALRPVPTWRFHGAGFTLERRLVLQQASTGSAAAPELAPRPGALLVLWRNLGESPLRLRIRPLLVGAADPALRREGATVDTVLAQGASWGFGPWPELPTMWLSVDGIAAFQAEPVWYRGWSFPAAAGDGNPAVEDRFSPGVLELDLPPGREAVASFSLHEPLASPTDTWHAALALASAADAAVVDARWVLPARLRRGATLFAAVAADGPAPAAPLSARLSRRAMLQALPGLLLHGGDGPPEQRRSRLATRLIAAAPWFDAAAPDAAVPGAAADLPLWFALAVARWADAGGGDAREFAQLVAAVRAIAARAFAGGGPVWVDRDGLVVAAPHATSSWMDARAGTVPVTPRRDQPVELAALWVALLAWLAETDGGAWRQRARTAGAAFVDRFWLPDRRRLADCRFGALADASVRPNMLVAAALARVPLDADQRAAVVASAERELRTPRGLRSLSPHDAAYRGVCAGERFERDAARHQGSVWPWFAGFYVEAALRCADPSRIEATRRGLRGWLDGFATALDAGLLDHVAELYDGDAPHEARGDTASAVNTAELLRATALLEGPSDRIAP